MKDSLLQSALTRACARAQNEEFLDSYIGFVAAGYSVKVRQPSSSLLCLHAACD